MEKKVNIYQSVEDIKKDFANGLTMLIDDPEKRSNLGKSAYEHVVKKYTWETKCKSFYENYLR